MPLKTEIHELDFRGQSMKPFLEEGDVLFVEYFTEDYSPDLRPGDVVLHRDQNELMAHRLVRSKPVLVCSDWGFGEWQDPLCGRVLGFRSGERQAFWGEHGHLGQSFLVSLSLLTGSPWRLIRWPAKAILLLAGRMLRWLSLR